MAEPSSGESIGAWSRWVAEANDALAGASDHGARWWTFGPPCDCFQLVVGDPIGDNVAIMLFWCRYLAGPASWKPHAIRVQVVPAPDNAPYGVSFLLEDPGAGFRAESGTLHWARNINAMDATQWRLWGPPGLIPGRR